MKKHVGAYLEGCVASDKSSNWVGELVQGRIPICVRVVPQRVIVVARTKSELRSEPSGLTPGTRCHGRARKDYYRAHESRRLTQQGHDLAQPVM